MNHQATPTSQLVLENCPPLLWFHAYHASFWLLIPGAKVLRHPVWQKERLRMIRKACSPIVRECICHWVSICRLGVWLVNVSRSERSFRVPTVLRPFSKRWSVDEVNVKFWDLLEECHPSFCILLSLIKSPCFFLGFSPMITSFGITWKSGSFLVVL